MRRILTMWLGIAAVVTCAAFAAGQGATALLPADAASAFTLNDGAGSYARVSDDPGDGAVVQERTARRGDVEAAAGAGGHALHQGRRRHCQRRRADDLVLDAIRRARRGDARRHVPRADARRSERSPRGHARSAGSGGRRRPEVRRRRRRAFRRLRERPGASGSRRRVRRRVQFRRARRVERARRGWRRLEEGHVPVRREPRLRQGRGRGGLHPRHEGADGRDRRHRAAELRHHPEGGGPAVHQDRVPGQRTDRRVAQGRRGAHRAEPQGQPHRAGEGRRRQARPRGAGDGAHEEARVPVGHGGQRVRVLERTHDPREPRTLQAGGPEELHRLRDGEREQVAAVVRSWPTVRPPSR